MQPEAIEAHITPRTKVLALVSPNNPTASAIDKRDHGPHRRRSQCGTTWWCSPTSCTRKWFTTGSEHVSIATFPGMRDRTIVINGFSKAYSMTGFRVGYMAGPPTTSGRARAAPLPLDLIADALPVRRAGRAQRPSGPYRGDDGDLHRRRDMMRATFDEIGVTYSLPRGGFYFFANIGGAGMDVARFLHQGRQGVRSALLPRLDVRASTGNVHPHLLPRSRSELREALRRFSALYRACAGAHAR